MNKIKDHPEFRQTLLWLTRYYALYSVLAEEFEVKHLTLAQFNSQAPGLLSQIEKLTKQIHEYLGLIKDNNGES